MLFGCATGDSYEVGGADRIGWHSEQYRYPLRPVVVNSIDHYCSAHRAVVVRPPTSSATECLLRRGIQLRAEKGHPLLGGARWKSPITPAYILYGTRASEGKQVEDVWSERGIEYRTF